MKEPKKIPLLKCIGILTISQGIILLLHLLIDGRLPEISNSISRYVGMTWWSATIFAIGNFLICFEVWRYFLNVIPRRKLSLIILVPIVLMTIGLIGLSVCPLGLFDSAPSEPSIVSRLHELFSRLMFLSSIVTAFIASLYFARSKKSILIAGLLFVAYGLFYVYSYVNQTYLIQHYFYIMEELFLYGFFAFLFMLPPVKPTKEYK